jgi:hypothetical protein
MRAHEPTFADPVGDPQVPVLIEAVEPPERRGARDRQGREPEREERSELQRGRREALDRVDPLVRQPVDHPGAVMDRMEPPETREVEEPVFPVPGEVREHDGQDERREHRESADDRADRSTPRYIIAFRRMIATTEDGLGALRRPPGPRLRRGSRGEDAA